MGMDLIYENPHTVFMQIKDLTEEEYYELYPQMKGIPWYVEPLAPDEVNRLFALRSRVKKVTTIRGNRPQNELSG
jgi:hypothetical protein